MKHILLFSLLTVLLAGCGGNTAANLAGEPAGPGGGNSVANPGGALSLGLLRTASGTPQGVRISWTRVDITGVQGYYIYRDTANIPDGDPAGHGSLRIDADGNPTGGNGMFAQTGSGSETLTFDDLFSLAVGDSYYYRLTVVNSNSDESDFSNEEPIEIVLHSITAVSQTDGSIGASVTIDGEYFGSSQSGDKVYFSDSVGDQTVEAATYTSWSQTQIVVTVPYGAADGKVAVEVGGVSVPSPADELFDYDEPAITAIAPSEDYVQNLYINLTGTDFGPAPSTVSDQTKIYFGTTPAQPADIDETTWSDTNIDVKVPAAAVGDAIDVYVSVAGSDSGTVGFTILPHIDSFGGGAPGDYQGSVGDSVTINGTNFGASQGADGDVFFGGTSAGSYITGWTNTAVTFTVPEWATDGAVHIKRDDGKETNGVNYDVVPTIDSFTPGRRVIGETLTIFGSGFGDSRGTSKVTFDGGAGIVATDYTWTNDQIEVTVPNLSMTGAITIEIDDDDTGGTAIDTVTSAESVVIILEAPVIEDIGQL